ncbi:MAG: rhomboid family intramembrane serine protease [Pseudomonadales bacterium]|nr:rhomboid family intramembrane serine protease [Pseudomonadales bacterium]
MYQALSVPKNQDLQPFDRLLSAAGIPHRISEEGERQLVWVRSAQEAAMVTSLYERYQAGELPQIPASGPTGAGSGFEAGLKLALRISPLTMGILILMLLFYPATWVEDNGDFGSLFYAMTIVPFEVSGNSLRFPGLLMNLQTGELWRYLSPVLLHFGMLHLVFNSLWFYTLGQKLELKAGRLWLLAVIGISGLASNILQFMLAENPLFGGMSGVIYGLVGMAMVLMRMAPERDIGLPQSIYWFMLGFLAFGFTGLFDMLGLGSLANWAHLGGLVAGFLTGVLMVLLQRLQTGSKPIS